MAALTRVAKTRSATLTHTFYVDETPTDPTGTPTVAIVAADGVAVQSGNGTIVGGSTGQVTFAMDAVSTLELLTATWTATVGGIAVVETDYVEIVGGFFFTLVEGRASDSSLSSTATYPTASLETARLEVEVECEGICDRAFVPRYDRMTLDGSGTTDLMLLPTDPIRSVADIRTIRTATIAPTVDGTAVALTSAQLAALAVVGDNVLRRTDGNTWTEGESNVVVEIEYGLSAPPPELKRQAMVRLRHFLNTHRSAVPDRAISFSLADGGTYRMDAAGAWKTGWPDVDAAYSRYGRRQGAGGVGNGASGVAVPASRTLDYTPQRYSLFHARRG